MADDLKIKVTIQGDDNLSGPAKSASKSLDGLNKAADQTTKSSGKAADSVNVLAHGLAGPVVAGATAVVGALAYATTTAAEFSKEISAIGAVTGASTDEMAQMRDLALDLGAKTAFSAREAAEGIGELAKGGASVADIMGGAATAALNLAAAGGVEVADAAALAANAMSLFNLEGKDMGKVVDNIAGFANATTGSVNDFKFALSAVGVAAKLSGQDFDQTATAIALMAKAGAIGSDAGTSLKTMLLNLIPSTKEAKNLMYELGLATNEVGNNFLNADDSFKDLRDIAGELSKAMDGLSEAQQQSSLRIIFGNDAVKAAGILAEAGAEGFDKMAESMSKVSAESVAAQRLDNLSGSMDALNGTVETSAILLGQELEPAIREVADGFNKFLGEEVIPFIKLYGPAFGQQLSETVKFLGMVAEAISPIVHVVGPLLLEFFSNWGRALDTTIELLYKTIVAGVNLKNAIEQLGPTLKTAAEGLGKSIVDGIAAGLNPQVVITKLQSLAGDALQAAKDKIEARSPSKVFAKEVGLPMALGMVDGLEQGAPAVEAAAREVAGRGLAAAAAYVRELGLTGGGGMPGPIGAGLRGAAGFARAWATEPELPERPGMSALESSLYGPLTTGRGTAPRAGLEQSLYGPGGRATGGSPWLNVTPNQAAIGARQGVAESLSRTELKQKMGEVGAAAWKAFIEATQSGSLTSGLSAGAAMQAVVDAAKAAGVPQWQALGATLMEAFNGSLVESTEISRAHVAELLSLAQTAVTAAQQIKTAARADQSYGAGTGGGGTGGTGGGSAHTPFDVKALAAAMAQQPIILQLDGQRVGQAVRTSNARASEQTLTYPSGIGMTPNGVGGVGGGGY